MAAASTRLPPGMRRESGAEGIVFHYGDGVRFAKIKARDFRPVATDA